RETTKRMLATVSELSMYQATALKLEEEKQRLGKALEEAQWRVAHDQAPSEDAVKEWSVVCLCTYTSDCLSANCVLQYGGLFSGTEYNELKHNAWTAQLNSTMGSV